MWRSDSNLFATLDNNVLLSSTSTAHGKSVARGPHVAIPQTTDTPPEQLGGSSMYNPRDVPRMSPSAFTQDTGLNISSSTAPEQRLAAAEDALRQSHRLVLRYRHESEGLRQQLKAAALREQLLSGRLEDAYREVARAKADAAHARAKTGSDDENSRVRAALVTREHELQTMQVRLVELEGRLKAYDEVFSRSPADASLSQVSAPPLSDVLCECWSDVEYLVKVVNAVQHCQSVPHDAEATASGCPRPLAACEARCLAAAVLGNVERTGEVRRRGHGLSPTQVALAVRDELQYCVAMTVRSAARRQLQQTAHTTPTTVEEVPHPNVDADADAEDGTDEKKHFEGARREEGDNDQQVGEGETVTSGGMSFAQPHTHGAAPVDVPVPLAAPRRARASPRPHTTVDDCHVQ